MCGRYALHSTPEVVALAFGLTEIPARLTPRYNIAPFADVLIVRSDAGGSRTPAWVRWSLLPRWVKDPKRAAKLNNARAETVAEKPSFRDAYRRRRCLIPADGFYEWKPEAGRKQPYYFSGTREAVLGLAGLWERWEGESGPIESCAIVTTDANAVMAPVHDRMPVIIQPEAYGRWLTGSPDDAAALLRPAANDVVRARRVGITVNRSSTEGPELIEPIED